jgi:hypothetical protein
MESPELRRGLRLLGLITMGVSGELGNAMAYRKGAVTKYTPPWESEEMVPVLAER